MHSITLISAIRIVGPQSSLSFSLVACNITVQVQRIFIDFQTPFSEVLLFIKSPSNTPPPPSGRVFVTYKTLLSAPLLLVAFLHKSFSVRSLNRFMGVWLPAAAACAVQVFGSGAKA